MTSAAPVDDFEKPPSPGRAWFVRIGVLLAVLMTVAGVGFLGSRWFKVRFPDSALEIKGDPTADGVQVTVWTPTGQPAPGTLQLTNTAPDGPGRLRAENNYTVIVLVQEGEYVVRAAAANGRPFLEQRIYVPSNRGFLVPLVVPPDLRPKTRPTTGPGSADRPVVPPAPR